MNRSKLTLELSVDDTGSVVVKQFGENAQKSFKQTEAAGVDLGRSLTYIKGILLTLAAAVGIAFGVSEVVNFAKEATMLTSRIEMLSEVVAVVGENAGYSRAETARYVDEIKAMGITTQAAQSSVIKMAQAQLDLSNASQLARAAQDAARISNFNSSETFERMIHGIRSGEVEILKTIGIAVNFEQAYVRQAQALGKTVAQLSEREKAEARFNATLEATLRIAGTYEATLGKAGGQMLSMSRYIENIKEKIGQAFSPALTAVLQAFTSDLSKIEEYFKDAASSGKAAAWAAAIKDAVTKAYDAFTSLGKIVITTASVLSDFWEVAKGVAVGFATFFVLKIIAAGDALNTLLWGIRNLGFVIQYFAVTTLPALMTPVGLAAVAIGGLAAALFLLKDAAEASDRELEAYALRVKSLPLDESVKKLEELKTQLRAVEESETRTPEQIENVRKMIALTESQVENLKKQNEQSERAAATASVANAEAERKAELQRKQIEQSKIMTKVNEEVYKREMELFEEAEKENAKYLENTKKEAIQTAKDRLEAERAIYKDLRKYSGEYYDATIRLIEEQAKKYRELGVDQAAVAAWVKEETIKAYIEMAQKSNDWMTGLRAGLLDMQRNMMTWGRAGYETFKTFATSSRDVVSSVLWDAWKGQLKSASDYWSAFTDAMLKKFVDVLAQMAVEWVLLQTFMRDTAVMGGIAGGMGMGAGAAAAGGSAMQLIPMAGGGYMLMGGGAAAGANPSVLGGAWTIEALGGSATVGSVLGAAGLGYLGGSMLGGQLFGDRNAQWAGLGAAIGAGAGMMYGPLGALIGGAAGTVIGGVANDAINAIGDAISSIGDFFGFHRGGVVGIDPPSFVRTMPAVAFAGAPRLHSGFAPDEFPAILQRGERVLSRRENRDYELGGHDTNAILYQMAKSLKKMERILSRFDDDGLPAERTLT